MPIPAGPDPIPGGTDYITPTLDVYPYDGTTFASLEVRPPTPAVAFTPGPCTPTLVQVEIVGVLTTVQRWTSPPVPTPGPYGWWVLAWTVAGTGGGAPEESVFIAPPPLPGGQVWAPTRSRVASYVPSRPLVPIADGRNIDLMTFDETTRPTGAQVDQLIVDAVNWVTDETGLLDTTLYESATACAAIRAAAFVELGYPERSDPMKDTANQTSDRLFKQAELMLARLAARNKAVTGSDGDDPNPAVTVLPLYSFPDPNPNGDLLIF